MARGNRLGSLDLNLPIVIYNNLDLFVAYLGHAHNDEAKVCNCDHFKKIAWNFEVEFQKCQFAISFRVSNRHNRLH